MPDLNLVSDWQVESEKRTDEVSGYSQMASPEVIY